MKDEIGFLDDQATLVLEKVPWHTVHDAEPRYKYDAIFTVHGITIRSCRLNEEQVRVLRKAGVEVVRVPCGHCRKHRCVCIAHRKPKKRHVSHRRKKP